MVHGDGDGGDGDGGMMGWLVVIVVVVMVVVVMVGDGFGDGLVMVVMMVEVLMCSSGDMGDRGDGSCLYLSLCRVCLWCCRLSLSLCVSFVCVV